MQKCMSDYLDAVCAEIRRKAVREAARAELTDHLITRRDKLAKEGMDLESASFEAVRNMGDPCALGMKIAVANRNPASKYTLFAGMALAAVSLWFIMLWGGGDWLYFLDLPTLISVAGLSSAYGLLCGGGKPTLVSFLHGVKTGAIYAGVIVMVTGIIILLGNLSDTASVGAGMAASLISVLYGALVSAGARIVEGWLEAPAPSVIQRIIE